MNHRFVDLAPQVEVYLASLFDFSAIELHAVLRRELLPIFRGKHVSAIIGAAALKINRKEGLRIHLEHTSEGSDGFGCGKVAKNFAKIQYYGADFRRIVRSGSFDRHPCPQS